MRRLPVMLIALAIAAPAVAADCTAEVKAAFAKQHANKSYRVAMTQPTAEGPVQMTVDYILPDKMLQTVVSPSMPGEQQTMLVGDRAFAGSGGGFEELLPQFTQSIVSEFRTSTSPESQNLGSYECLGKQTFEGKAYAAYRTADKAPSSGPALARTIYVDEATGLPAFNVVAELQGNAEPIMKVIYSYPTDIEIVAPQNAPIQKPVQ